jgi:hypothetical protein
VEWAASRAEWDAAAWVDFPEGEEWEDIPAGDAAVAVVETDNDVDGQIPTKPL